MARSRPELDLTPAADEPLGAPIAADRLVLPSVAGDSPVLLQRRLAAFYGYFYGYFALVGVVGVLLDYTETFPVDADPHVLARLSYLILGHTVLLACVFVAVRRSASVRILRLLDGFATVVTAIVGALALSMVPYGITVDVSAVAFFILFFALRAALVPQRPWLATLTTALAAIPFTIGLAIMYRRAQLPNADGATFASLRAMLGGAVGVYLVSRTIYGLRRVVREVVQLGQYTVHEKIGEGGMGTVYRASHAMLRRPTAIKLISAERAGPSAIARFEREVLAASRLTHPNNVAVYDFGRTRGGVFYYAMELLDGEDLERLVAREGPQTVARTLHILSQVTAALGEAHAAGLVHRDVKPANIMLCTRGGVANFVKVLDFGLVKDTSAHTQLTADTSAALGTPLYMAPEAIATPGAVTAAADVYALGCLAHFLLTGRPPFLGKTPFEVCAAHLYAEPEAPSTRVDGLPAGLDALVLHCLAKDPKRRPTTRELEREIHALQTVVAGPAHKLLDRDFSVPRPPGKG